MVRDSPLDEGVLLASGGYDGIIKVWSAYSGTSTSRSLSHAETQVHPPQINCLDISPDRGYFIAGGFQSVKLYDVCSNNSNPIVSYDGLSKNVTSLGCEEDFSFMFTTGEDKCAKIWDARAAGSQCQRMFEAHSPLNSGVLHPNQTTLYLTDQKGAIYMWDLRNNHNEKLIINKQCSIQSVHVDSQAAFAAAVDNKGKLYVFRLDEPTLEGTPFFSENPLGLRINAHETYGLKTMFSPDSNMLITTSADCRAKLWSVSELEKALENAARMRAAGEVSDTRLVDTPMKPIKELFREGQRWVWDVEFTMDSENVFTASSDNLIRLWNIESGEVVREYSGHSKAVIAIAFKDRPIP